MLTQNTPATSLTKTIDYAFYPRIPPISLELTNNCNLKCPYCANITLTRPKTYIDWTLFEKIVDECSQRQLNLAYLHGVGEPLLWDRLEEAVGLIKRKNAGAGSFATNGTLLRPDRVKRLLDVGLEHMYISIDTLDPEIYRNTRGGRLDKVIKNIQDTIATVPSTFRITIALMNHKDHKITEETLAKFYETFGHQENVSTNLVQNQLFPGASDYRTDGAKIQSCFSPANFLFIALDGRAAVCCMDQDVRYTLGDVHGRSIHDIWFDPQTQTTFRNIALGVFSCPEVCTKDCVLAEPRQNETVTQLGFGASYDVAAQTANDLIRSSNLRAAFPIVSALAARDPFNGQIQHVLNQLKARFNIPVPKPTGAPIF